MRGGRHSVLGAQGREVEDASVFQKAWTRHLRVKDASERWSTSRRRPRPKTEAPGSRQNWNSRRSGSGLGWSRTHGLHTQPGRARRLVVARACPRRVTDREESRLRKNVLATPSEPCRASPHRGEGRDHLTSSSERAAPASVNMCAPSCERVLQSEEGGALVGPNPIVETEPRRVPKRVIRR